MSKKLVMSIQQFNAVQRGELTYKDIKEINKMESIAGEILKDSRLTRMSCFLFGSLMYCQSVSATTDALGPINEAGNMFLGIIQTVGYWLCLLMCLVEIIKALMNGQGDKCAKIAIKYLCIFAGLYCMPWAFNLIKDIFGGL